MIPGRAFTTNGLLATVAERTGRPCGDGEIPDGHGEVWTVLRSLGAGGDTFDGPPLVAPDEDAAWEYQLDSVGQTRQQAERMSDRVRNAVLARFDDGTFKFAIAAPTGYRVADRRPGTSFDAQRTGSAPNFLWTVRDRFVLVISPDTRS